MVFNSLEFIGCFAILLAVLWPLRFAKLRLKLRNLTLLVASYCFYGYFNLGFLGILIYVTLINYATGFLLLKGTSHKKTLTGLCIGLSLLPLVFYKYAFFLLSGTASLLNLELNLELVQGLLLPVGISFFTFQALTYPLDIYREKITQDAGIVNFSLFVSLFPTILSGPIEKARNLLPQLQRYTPSNIEDVGQGFAIFVWGVFKKMVIADRLANYVDWAYDSSQYLGGTTLAVAAIFYSLQIYCDFSGYSDMALGIAKAMGFDITKNFRQPYFSKTIKEFWRKWHIALTSWFTEYVYFSLGGSRVKHKVRWIFNISTVFILSGLWHGASWNFLIWGSLHAVFYLVEHFVGLQKETLKWTRLTSIIGGIAVFAMVTFAWIFFRVENIGQTAQIIFKIFTLDGPRFSAGASTFTFYATIGMLIVFLGYEFLVRRKILWYDCTQYEKSLARNIFSTVPLLILIAMFGMGTDNFVYFQF